jgi:hypothetical protein
MDVVGFGFRVLRHYCLAEEGIGRARGRRECGIRRPRPLEVLRLSRHAKGAGDRERARQAAAVRKAFVKDRCVGEALRHKPSCSCVDYRRLRPDRAGSRLGHRAEDRRSASATPQPRARIARIAWALRAATYARRDQGLDVHRRPRLGCRRRERAHPGLPDVLIRFGATTPGSCPRVTHASSWQRRLVRSVVTEKTKRRSTFRSP